VSFGTASSTRVVAVYIAGIFSTGSISISSCTIGGVSATLAVSAGDTSYPTAIYYASVPSGTTGDVVVTFNTTVSDCAIGVWSLYDVNATPKSSGGKNTSTAFPSISFAANDIGIFGDFPGGAGTTWTNATEDFDVASWHTGASYQAVSAGSRTVSNSFSDATYGAYAVWGS